MKNTELRLHTHTHTHVREQYYLHCLGKILHMLFKECDSLPNYQVNWHTHRWRLFYICDNALLFSIGI